MTIRDVKLYTIFFILFLDTLNDCTFTKTGKSYANHVDHYYQCITCDMTDDGQKEGHFCICTNCIKICHAKHDVKYVRYGAHYCDCGEKGEKSCKALKSKKSI